MKLLYTVDENIKCCSHYGKQYSGSSKNETQNYHMIQQFHFWVYTQKNLRAETPTDISTPVFTAALVTTAKRWKQPKCPLTEEWINKMWYAHSMEYYLAVKRKEIVTHVT